MSGIETDGRCRECGADIREGLLWCEECEDRADALVRAFSELNRRKKDTESEL